MAGRIGALNLLDSLDGLRQPDVQTYMTPVCLQRSACLPVLQVTPTPVWTDFCVFFWESVSWSSATFLLPTMTFSLPSWFWLGSRFPLEVASRGSFVGENVHRVFLPSPFHPLRRSRAAVRKESACPWSFSRGSESRGPGTTVSGSTSSITLQMAQDLLKVFASFNVNCKTSRTWNMTMPQSYNCVHHVNTL